MSMILESEKQRGNEWKMVECRTAALAGVFMARHGEGVMFLRCRTTL